MSGFERRGRWNVPRRLTTFTLWGGGVVDLRYADFTSPEVEIHTYSIMGGQTIVVPPEVNVDLRGHGVMGTFDHLDTDQGLPGAPRVTVRGFSLWGKVARQAQEAQDRLTPALRDATTLALLGAEYRRSTAGVALQVALAHRKDIPQLVGGRRVQYAPERPVAARGRVVVVLAVGVSYLTVPAVRIPCDSRRQPASRRVSC